MDGPPSDGPVLSRSQAHQRGGDLPGPGPVVELQHEGLRQGQGRGRHHRGVRPLGQLDGRLQG